MMAKMAARNTLSVMTFPESTPKSARIAALAPMINQALADFASGTMRVGNEDFDQMMQRVIEGAGLWERRAYDVAKVAIHPDNREEEMAVVGECHYLVDRMVEDGFNPKRWSALACTLPPGPEGLRWIELNLKLITDTDGYLAPVRADEIEIFTARGSHGTSALRIAKLGAKSVHAHLAGPDGMVSKEVICELAPSLRDPIDNGVYYDVIPGELAVACPTLMETLSRNGNNFNDVFRLQSSLQICSRIHKLSLRAGSNDDWEAIAQRACQGNGGKNFLPQARMIADFVQAWSGGKDAHFLKELEQYEKSLDFKRKLSPAHLQSISKIQTKFPKYIVALVKAMLSAPSADQGGYCNTFDTVDFVSASWGGKNAASVEAAATLMQQAETFLDAYSSLPSSSRSKALDKLQVRLVMRVHSKGGAQRASFDSLDAVAVAFYEEVKKEDVKLPAWPRIAAMLKNKGSNKPDAIKVQEVAADGTIADSELEARSFTEGSLITSKCKAQGATENQIYKIKSIKPNLQGIIIEEVDSEGKAKPAPKPKAKAGAKKTSETELIVARADLLLKYKIHEIKAKEFLGDYPDVCDNIDVFAAVLKGEITSKMVALYGKSSEDDLNVLLQPSRAVLADRAFNVGAMKIAPVSVGLIFVSMEKPAPVNALCIGKSEHQFVNIFLRSSNNLTKDPKFVSKFYLIRVEKDSRTTNCEIQAQTFNIKFNGEDITIKLPMAVNTRKVNSGEEIVMMSPYDPVKPGVSNKRVKKN